MPDMIRHLILKNAPILGWQLVFLIPGKLILISENENPFLRESSWGRRYYSYLREV